MTSVEKAALEWWKAWEGKGSLVKADRRLARAVAAMVKKQRKEKGK